MSPLTFEALVAGPCPPCHAGTPPLGRDEITALARALAHGWTVRDPVDGAPPCARLTKTFRFADFGSALAYVDRVGAMCEEVQHHPDVHLAWGRVTLEIWTHVAGGLTLTDFAWAARAEALAP